MKDQELHDIFHAYRPEIDDNDAFMDQLSAQMDAIDAQQQTNESDPKQQPRIVPLYRRILPWFAGIAAAVLVALVLINPAKDATPQPTALYPAYLDRGTIKIISSDPFSSYKKTLAEIEQSGQQLQLAIAEMKEE